MPDMLPKWSAWVIHQSEAGLADEVHIHVLECTGTVHMHLCAPVHPRHELHTSTSTGIVVNSRTTECPGGLSVRQLLNELPARVSDHSLLPEPDGPPALAAR
jgi:hypothetical protein